MRGSDLIGPVLCGLGAAFMLVALAVSLDSTAAKALMVVAAALFVPGALISVAWLRHRLGTPP